MPGGGGMHAVASAGLTSNDVTQRELQRALQFPPHHALRRAPAGALQAGAAAMHTGRAGWISFINTCPTHADIRPADAAAAARTRVKQTANESVPTVMKIFITPERISGSEKKNKNKRKLIT